MGWSIRERIALSPGNQKFTGPFTSPSSASVRMSAGRVRTLTAEAEVASDDGAAEHPDTARSAQVRTAAAAREALAREVTITRPTVVGP
ncbi:hypothetical protein GCM10009638_11210 [Luteococcus sanguinis]